MSPDDRKSVLVVGAGPVGFCTALRLAQAGVPVTLVEKEAALQDDLRASTFHPPTLEMLDDLALTQGLLDAGLRTDTWQIRLHETHEKAEFDLDIIRGDTRYPYRLQVEQRVLCRLAADKVAAEPLIDLRMNTELLAFKQNDDRVKARLRGPDGDLYEIKTPFMIAADGSKSVARKLLDLPFEGLTYPEMTILATTHFPFEQHLPGLSNVNYVWYSGGTFSLLRLPNVWRVSLYPDEGESEEHALEPASLQQKLQRIVPRDEPYIVEESRPYRIHQRIVGDYRVGRILLVGDAAHLNSPSGGMGMNGGIHDAFNLTEKLPPVWRGDTELESLDRYTRQRRPIAREQILKQAHANRTRMQERDPQKRRAELERLQAIAGDREKSREYLLRSSMITGLREAAALT
ncbi:MAG: FAD-dependent oxidoreductase [Gammaproteobacteria bacterium]